MKFTHDQLVGKVSAFLRDGVPARIVVTALVDLTEVSQEEALRIMDQAMFEELESLVQEIPEHF
jgi:hypothetical protein